MVKLSQSIQSFVDAQDSDAVRWGIPPELVQLAESVARELVESREGITDNKYQPMESLLEQKLPDVIDYVLDEHFSRVAVDKVSGYVTRTKMLSRLPAINAPSRVTSMFMQEAVRTFIFGFPMASAALSRAALEQALKEHMGYQSKHEKVGIRDLLAEAEGANLLDNVTRKMADEVVRIANLVLHERPTTLDEAFEALVNLRGVIQHVYDVGA